MFEADLIQIFVDRLEKTGLPYMVTGSVACIVYGEPRVTHDIDLVIELVGLGAVEALKSAFAEEEFYLPPVEIIRIEQARALRGHFNIIHHDSGFKADIYLLGEDLLHKWALGRRRILRIGESSLAVAPPEYVIIRKLEYYREGRSDKHLRDIAGVLRVSDDGVDRNEVVRLASVRGLMEEWALALGFLEKSH